MPMLVEPGSSAQPLTVLLWVVSFVGFAALAAAVRLGYRRYRLARGKVIEAWGDLFGREAVLHPNTREEILPASPGIGMRLTSLERGQSDLTHALQKIAEQQDELARIDRRIDEEVEQRELLHKVFEAHLDDSKTNKRLEHDEAAKMWSAIEAIARAEPSRAETTFGRPGDAGDALGP